MSAFTVTVRQFGRPPLTFYAIGATSCATGESIAAHFDVCGISVIPL